MRLEQPIRYGITFDSLRITGVNGPDGRNTFVAPVTNPGPKVYVIVDRGRPIYIGATNQPIRNRLRLGFQADGNNGYSGYLWRHSLTDAEIDIWLVTVEDEDVESMRNDPSVERASGNEQRLRDIVIETLEGEVAFLIRKCSGQWPKYQVEIHFHQSQETHRQLATEIVDHYRSPRWPIA